MNHSVNFGYSGNFYLSSNDIDEILDRVHNGLTVEEAVEDWIYELDDLDYYVVEAYVKNRIMEHIEQIVEDA